MNGLFCTFARFPGKLGATAAAAALMLAPAAGADHHAHEPTPAEAAETSTTDKGYLGVAVGEAPAPEGVELDAPVLVLARVQSGSAAARAGLQTGDTLLKLEGQRLVHPEQLRRLVAAYPAGQKVDLTVWRDGEARNLTATLDARPAALERQPPIDRAWRPGFEAPQRWGHQDFDRELDQMRQRMDRQFEEMREMLEQQRDLQLDLDDRPLIPEATGPGHTALQVLDDGQVRLTIRQDADGRHLEAVAADGDVLYQGPIDTAEQIEQLPDAVKQRLPESVRTPGDQPQPPQDVGRAV
jgi:hypothetical protein